MDETSTGVSSRYTGNRGAQYTAERQSSPASLGYQLNLEYFLPHLRRDDRVLDFGCGNGGMLRLLRPHVKEAEGLEVNPNSAALARESGLTVYGKLADLPPERPYTVVLSNHVLEHVRDVPSTLEQVRRNMVSGGRLLLKLPLDDWRDPIQRRWSKEDVDHHLQTWTPRLIANVLFESGFEVDDIRIVTSAWHSRLFPLVKWGLGKPAFWALAALYKRRQLFVMGHAP
jgi:SAM-dependent methyltransferase